MPQPIQEDSAKSARATEQELGRRVQRTQRDHERAVAAPPDFMRSISHEVRNHLQMIGNITQLLAQSPGAESKRFLQMLEESSSCLAGLVKDILDYHRHEAERRAVREAE